MAEDQRQIVVCSCEDTMPLDVDTIRKACRGADIVAGRQLCRAEIERFRALAGSGSGDLIVACTQEIPVFEEAAEAAGPRAPVFVNIRESAGWSNEAARAAPKMAALLAAAAEPMAPPAKHEVM